MGQCPSTPVVALAHIQMDYDYLSYADNRDRRVISFSTTLPDELQKDWLTMIKQVLQTYKNGEYASINAYSRRAIENFVKGSNPLGVTYTYPMIEKNASTFYKAFYTVTDPLLILASGTGSMYFLREPEKWQREAIVLIMLNDLAIYSAPDMQKSKRVYRGIQWVRKQRTDQIRRVKPLFAIGPSWQEEFKEGEIITQTSLWSTSILVSVAMRFYKDPCCLFVIDLPAYFPAMWMDEAELLLVPFKKDGSIQQYKIVSRKQEAITYRPNDIKCYVSGIQSFDECMTAASEVTRTLPVVYCKPI